MSLTDIIMLSYFQALDILLDMSNSPDELFWDNRSFVDDVANKEDTGFVKNNDENVSSFYFLQRTFHTSFENIFFLSFLVKVLTTSHYKELWYICKASSCWYVDIDETCLI